jgi:hypothetical protein
MVVRRILLFLAAATLALPLAQAQKAHDPGSDVFLGGPKYKKEKKPTSRTLRGTVTDDSGKPLAGALVTLTNVAKGEKLTFITKADGRYHFDELPFRVDYEVSAQYEKMRSPVKKLSQYDDATPAVRILEVEPEKTADSKPE